MTSEAPGSASSAPSTVGSWDSHREPLGSRRRCSCSGRVPPSLLHVTLVGGPVAAAPRLQSSTRACSGPRITCSGPGPQLSDTVVSWGNGCSPAERRDTRAVRACPSTPHSLQLRVTCTGVGDKPRRKRAHEKTCVWTPALPLTVILGQRLRFVPVVPAPQPHSTASSTK